jgi:hypothetical protein
VGGFPGLSEVAFELSQIQQLQDFGMLGFVPQPNLHLHHIFCEMVLLAIQAQFSRRKKPLASTMLKGD